MRRCLPHAGCAARSAKLGAIRLAVDAVEDLVQHSDISHVVFVAGDSDYVPLAQRCKRIIRLKDGLGEDAYRRVRDGWADAAALGKACTAEDVAQTIVWLIADAALVTGQLLTVDGGYLLGRPTRVAR